MRVCSAARLAGGVLGDCWDMASSLDGRVPGSREPRARRVLVVRLDSMGDMLISGPAIRAVAASASVTVLAGPQGAAAAALLPGVGEVLEWNSPWISAPAPAVTAEHIASLSGLLGSERFDEAVVLTSFHQSPLPIAVFLRLAGINRITGVSTDYAGSLLDVRLRPGVDLDEDQPEPERGLAIAAAAGFHLPAHDDGSLRVLPSAGAADLTGRDPYVVVHPGASVPARAWSAEQNRETVRLLAERGTVIVTGGPDERDLTRFVAGEHGLDLGGRLDLAALAGVLAGADVVVAPNTGPAHLAAAVGTAVVSLFAPVVPAVRWQPYGVPIVLLGDQNAPCRGSRSRICPVPGHPCLTSVTPSDVVEACHRLAHQFEKEPTS